MRNFKRLMLGLAAGGCLLASGCFGTFGPQAATRVAINGGLLSGVVTETTNTLANLFPLAEAAAVLVNQSSQNSLCQTTGCPGAGLGSNNSGF